MSTDGSERPLTRAELRALRAAEQQAQQRQTSDDLAPVRASDVEVSVAEAEEDATLIPEDAPAEPVPAPVEEKPAPQHAAPEHAAPEHAAPEQEAPRDAGRPDTARAHPATAAPAGTRPSRRFPLALVGVLAVLALFVTVLGIVSVTQGPRLSQVQVDPAQAIQSSGSRVILTANQSLAAIDPKQVTVEPAVPFTVDAAGRNVGIRFTVPLDDATKYTVRVGGATSVGGGPASDLTTSFTTPASRILLLQRGEGDDRIFSTDLSGEKAVAVFSHPRISDYRATGDRLVVAVEEEDGSRLIVMDRDGGDQRDLKLPGDGYVSAVQVSDRGGLVGYSYSDRELTESSGRASVLVTQPLSGAGDPRIVEVGGAEASVADWQFVPDSSSLLFIDFNGALGVEDPTSDAGVQAMGNAASILGISRGTYTAIVERTDASVVELNLTDGSEAPLPASEPDYGDATNIEPFPGGTLRHVVQRDAGGMPTGQAVVKVDEKGAATLITEVSGTDAIIQACVSPSGQYAAVTVAPDLPGNAYDDLLLPLPTTLHTRLIALDSDQKLPILSGFDISWCRLAPQP